MYFNKQSVLCTAAFVFLAMAVTIETAVAKEAGDWIVRAGITYIDPKSNSGTVLGDPTIELQVGSATMLTFDGTYMVTDNFGVELLAALPFKHDIYGEIDGDRQKLATTKQLPPTLSAVYHFNTQGKFQPYVGAGINWTIFFDEQEKNLLDDLDVNLKLTNSLGLAAVVGIDIALTEKMFLNGNIRYMDIDTDVKLDGNKVATAAIDPWVYTLNIGWKI
jgi:outer membrane protein